jgi:ethylmalonyl-CoA/methylmalonyl-CoA decarboxylase
LEYLNSNNNSDNNQIASSNIANRPTTAVIRLHNPKRHNAMSPRMMLDFADCVDELSRHLNYQPPTNDVPTSSQASTTTTTNSATNKNTLPSTPHSNDEMGKLYGSSLRLVIVTGAGTSFCTGLDLSSARTVLTTPQSGLYMSQFMQHTLQRLHSLPILSIAAVDGYAMGGGAELATACDLRVMSRRSVVQFVQLKMGVTPGWGGGTRLVRMVGREKALEMLLTMTRLGPYEALDMGFCSNVFEGEF